MVPMIIVMFGEGGLSMKRGTEGQKEAPVSVCDRPLAAAGLTSYRCKGPFGWIMIGAVDVDAAMREAKRSRRAARREDLQVWNGERYVPVCQQWKCNFCGAINAAQDECCEHCRAG